jgi:hypothetical protein
MNKTLKTFAIAILATGATVTATRAPAATTTTNTQVLDNISVALKIYQQGDLKTTPTGKGDSLAAPITTFTTYDLIQQLAPFAGFTAAKNQKLVLSTVFSNFLVATGAATSTTNVFVIAGGGNGSVDYMYPAGGINVGTNSLDFGSGTTTNSYYITNSYGNVYLYQISTVGTNPPVTSYYDNIASIAILTNFYDGTNYHYGVATNINTNLVANGYQPFSYWTTIALNNSTNVVVTEYTPTTVNLFTNASSHVCVMTPKSSSAAESLIDVDNWVSFGDKSDYTGDSFSFYKEMGNDLSGDDFAGTNITSQTVYSYGTFSIFTAWPTNGAPAGQTNIIFANRDSDTPLGGFQTSMTKFINLTVNGNSKDKAVFQVIGSGSAAVSGVGYIGGSLTTNFLQTNTTFGVTTTNLTFGSANNWLGTNHIYQNGGNSIYIQDTTDVLAVGTITMTFLSAEPVIVPAKP